MRELLAQGGMLVASGGSPDSCHLYLRLAEPLEATVLEGLNRRLARWLGADAKWDRRALLRLAGSKNHKPAVHGGDPAPVELLEIVGGPGWSVADLEELLPPLPAVSTNGSCSAVVDWDGTGAPGP